MKFLTSFHLKIFAIVLMTVDHVGFIFELDTIYRIIGRVSFPIFAFLIYQGYTYTRNKWQYFNRLFLFGVGIEVVLILITLIMPIYLYSRNIFLLLAFGVLGFLVMDSKFNWLYKAFLIALLAYIAQVLNFDYGAYGFLFILSFRFYPKYFGLSILLQVVLTYLQIKYDHGMSFQYYALASWPIIFLYNQQMGLKLNKYIFYVYYPLHLGILYLLAEFL